MDSSRFDRVFPAQFSGDLKVSWPDGKRIAVMHIGMDETSLPRRRILVSIGETVAAVSTSVITL